MIDRKELKGLVHQNKTIIRERIKKLTEMDRLLNDIKKYATNKHVSDEFMVSFIKGESYYRQAFDKLDDELSEMEKSLWDQMLNIDRTEEKEEL